VDQYDYNFLQHLSAEAAKSYWESSLKIPPPVEFPSSLTHLSLPKKGIQLTDYSGFKVAL
jgi:hypothetical protein